MAEQSSEGSDLARDTAIEPIAKVPGHYVANFPPSWNYIYPCGGALMTVALRAMTRELAMPEMRLLSATTVFCQPIMAGELIVRVDVLRRGETAAQIRASLTGKEYRGPGLEVIATFAKDRPGPDVLGIEMPKVPAPTQCTPVGDKLFPEGKVPFPFYRNVDVAQAIGQPMVGAAWDGGEAHAAFWYRYRVDQRDDRGEFDPLAIPPIADTMPGALHRRLGPQHPRFLAPSLDLTVFFLAPTRSSWALVETRCERALGGVAVCSANIWDEGGALIARAAQSMTLRDFPPSRR
jgi:acyl-CoA thioesterase